MEAHGGDVLADAVVVNDGVGVVGVEVVHADVLVACNNDRAGDDRRSPDPCPGRRRRGGGSGGLTCGSDHAAVRRDLQGVHLLQAPVKVGKKKPGPER